MSRKFAKQIGSFWSETSEKQRRGSGLTKSKKAAHLDRVYYTGTKADRTRPESWRYK